MEIYFAASKNILSDQYSDRAKVKSTQIELNAFGNHRNNNQILWSVGV